MQNSLIKKDRIYEWRELGSPRHERIVLLPSEPERTTQYVEKFWIYEWSERGRRDMDCIGRMVMRPSERERTSQYRNRAYHPGLGRFMSEDPKGFDAGDNNFFRYVGNDPLDRVDPMGLDDHARTPAEVNTPMRMDDREPWNVTWEREQNATASGINARAYAVDQAAKAEAAARGNAPRSPSDPAKQGQGLSKGQQEYSAEHAFRPEQARVDEARAWLAKHYPQLGAEKGKINNSKIPRFFLKDGLCLPGIILIDTGMMQSQRDVVRVVAHELMHRNDGSWFTLFHPRSPARHDYIKLEAARIGFEFQYNPDGNR